MVDKEKGKESCLHKYANADETREAILAAALEEFAARSIEGARTREIARKAKVNHAAINYHFGGKREMYERIIIETVCWIEKAYAPVNEEVENFLEEDGKDPKKAIDFIKKILIFHHSFFYHPSFRKFYLLTKREEIFPTSAFDTVLERTFKPMHQNFMKLVDIATHFKKTKKETSIFAVALMGLNGALISCRTPFLKMNGQADLTKEDTELFTEITCEAVEKLLK